MPDANHYRQLLDSNTNALVNLTLAASAVYAARNGQFKPNDTSDQEWKGIYRDLKSKYGENLTPEQVRREMTGKTIVPMTQMNIRIPSTLAARLRDEKTRTGEDIQVIIARAVENALE